MGDKKKKKEVKVVQLLVNANLVYRVKQSNNGGQWENERYSTRRIFILVREHWAGISGC